MSFSNTVKILGWIGDLDTIGHSDRYSVRESEVRHEPVNCILGMSGSPELSRSFALRAPMPSEYYI